MKHIKLFEEFVQHIDEGAIPVYPPGNPWKNRGSIQWTAVAKMMTDPTKWKKEYDNPTNYTLVADFDFDKYCATEGFRSKALGTWDDKALPTWKEKNSRYDESEFDFVEIIENKEKPNEPWIKIQDKKGNMFMIPPFEILDIQIGSSVKDDIISGEKFLVDNMRATITNYKDGKVYIKLQNGETKEYTLDAWNAKGFTALDESQSTDEDEDEGMNPIENSEDIKE
jgi:hypothetical protein